LNEGGAGDPAKKKVLNVVRKSIDEETHDKDKDSTKNGESKITGLNAGEMETILKTKYRLHLVMNGVASPPRKEKMKKKRGGTAKAKRKTRHPRFIGKRNRKGEAGRKRGGESGGGNV